MGSNKCFLRGLKLKMTLLQHWSMHKKQKGQINVANKKETNLPCVRFRRLDFYMRLIDIE